MVFDESDFFPQARISPRTGLAIDVSPSEEEIEFFAKVASTEIPSSETSPFFNQTHQTSQKYLPWNKSKLIDKAAVLFKETIRSVKGIGSRQPVLERIEIDEIRDGDVVSGRVIFSVTVFPLSQPGMNWSYESVPLRARRITIPIEIRNGELFLPTRFEDSGGRSHPLSEIADFLYSGRPGFVRKRTPRVQRSWDIPRDYRAF